MAFRRKDSPNDSASICLKELEGEYTFTNIDTKESYKGGADIKIVLPGKYSCTIYKYSK